MQVFAVHPGMVLTNIYIFPSTVQVFAVHPGMVLTNISRTLPAWVQRLYFLVMGRILLTPSQVGRGGIRGLPGHHSQDPAHTLPGRIRLRLLARAP